MNTDLLKDEKKMKRLMSIELEILDEFDRVCREHGLRYSLAYGTLIGAVRHGGFIPWDDDIDVIMPRDDYKRFLNIWNSASSEKYVLVEYKKNPDYPCNFAKIRMDNTYIIQHEYEKNRDYHKGIFIDIFPFDRRADGILGSRLQYVACVTNLLYSRGFRSEHKGIIGLGEAVLLKLPKKARISIRNTCERIMSHWNDKTQFGWFGSSRIGNIGVVFRKDLFEDLKTISFEGTDYLCINNYDDFLRRYYGDYMKLPLESERVLKHPPIEISFNHNYRME